MFIKDQIILVCQSCKSEGVFKVRTVINIAAEPETRSAIENGSLFVYKCPNCGSLTHVNYDLLYHDENKKFMIFCNYPDDLAQITYDKITDTGENSPFRQLKENGYRMRIVRSQDELREKIMIFDNNLDDRVVEVFKVFSKMKENIGHLTEKGLKMLYFRMENKDLIQIIENGALGGCIEMPRDHYVLLQKRFGDKIENEKNNDPIIDETWARKTLFGQQPS